MQPWPLINIGFIEGGTLEAVQYFLNVGANLERVFDLYTFETGWFKSGGIGGASSFGGADIKGYMGIVVGWSNFVDEPDIENYSGKYFSASLDGGVAKFLAAGVMVSTSTDQNYSPNGNLVVVAAEMTGGWHLWPFPISGSVTARGNTKLINGSRTVFRSAKRPTRNDAERFATYISMQPEIGSTIRLAMTAVVLYNGRAWETQP